MSEKEPELTQFLRSIRGRLGTSAVLAKFAGVGHCHLSSMLNGDTARGVRTWPKLRRQVMAVEWRLLEQCSAWKIFAKEYPLAADTVLHSPTLDDRDNPLLQVVCADCGDAVKLLRCTSNPTGRVSHGSCAGCYSKKMSELTSADEIARDLQRFAIADAANPLVIPLRAEEDGQLELSPS